MASNPPKVLISYSHDSIQHKDLVLCFAERLRSDGVDAQIDQYVSGVPQEGWPRWMLNQLDWAEFVLVVCRDTYYRRFRGLEEPGKGRGVDWEGNLITIESYNKKSRTTKFVPVFFNSNDEKFIPEPLGGQNRYVLDSDENYDNLYAFLVGQAGVSPGEVGPLKTLARKQVEPLRFGGAGAQEVPVGAPYHAWDLPGSPVTLLHVSDMQFGRHHQFVHEPDSPHNEFDTLLERIWDDIALLREKEGLKPDLLICTGDLAEWAWPKEFAAPMCFLGELADRLELKRDRVVVIPGNHDVNRKDCLRYFEKSIEGGEPIVAPWYAKWKEY